MIRYKIKNLNSLRLMRITDSKINDIIYFKYIHNENFDDYKLNEIKILSLESNNFLKYATIDARRISKVSGYEFGYEWYE